MAIKMETLHKVRLLIPEIIVIDGRMYKPTVRRRNEISDKFSEIVLEEIISEDEQAGTSNPNHE